MWVGRWLGLQDYTALIRSFLCSWSLAGTLQALIFNSSIPYTYTPHTLYGHIQLAGKFSHVHLYIRSCTCHTVHTYFVR